VGQPLAGGVVDYGHPAVGLVNGCTADLIGDTTVITACHCIAYHGQRVSFCSAGWVNCVSGTAYAGPYCNPYSYNNDFDLAIVKLDQSYRALYGVVPNRISPWAPSKNNAITVVGFGCTNWNGSGATGYGTKRYAYGQIDSVKSWKITFDENDPYGGMMGCDGDSGGPVFKHEPYLEDCQIGVISGRAWVPFNWFTVAGRVDVWNAWIRTVANDPSVYLCNQTVCGDGICHSQELCSSCSVDCGGCPPPPPPVCGDGVCDAGEDLNTCYSDCGGPVCGDGVCDAGEDRNTCYSDCSAPVCGDGVCDVGEDCYNDCGGTPCIVCDGSGD
jgi:hypothetical protein